MLTVYVCVRASAGCLNVVSVAELLSSNEGVKRVMGDVLRVLGIYRRLWLAEIYSEIIGMNRTLGVEPEVKVSDVREAVERLASLGFVSVEERVRASFGEPSGVEDLLVTLKLSPSDYRLLVGDEKFRAYQRARYEAYERLKERLSK